MTRCVKSLDDEVDAKSVLVPLSSGGAGGYGDAGGAAVRDFARRWRIRTGARDLAYSKVERAIALPRRIPVPTAGRAPRGRRTTPARARGPDSDKAEPPGAAVGEDELVGWEPPLRGPGVVETIDDLRSFFGARETAETKRRVRCAYCDARFRAPYRQTVKWFLEHPCAVDEERGRRNDVLIRAGGPNRKFAAESLWEEYLRRFGPDLKKVARASGYKQAQIRGWAPYVPWRLAA